MKARKGNLQIPEMMRKLKPRHERELKLNGQWGIEAVVLRATWDKERRLQSCDNQRIGTKPYLHTVISDFNWPDELHSLQLKNIQVNGSTYHTMLMDRRN